MKRWLKNTLCLALAALLVYPAPYAHASRTLINSYVIAAAPGITTGLVSYWAMDEKGGTRFDSWGSNDLTDNNTVTYTTGIVSNAAQFTAANSEFLSVASNTSLKVAGNQSFTIACWVYFDTLGANRPIFTKRGSTGADIEYQLAYMTGDGGTSFAVAESDGTLNYLTQTTVSATTWYLYIGWYDSATSKIYLQTNNGTPLESAAVVTSTLDQNNTVRFGQLYSGTFYHNGALDGCGLWKRVLTSDERTALYNGGSGDNPLD